MLKSGGMRGVLLLLAIMTIWAASARRTGHGQVPAFASSAQAPALTGDQAAVLAGGCFWGVDAVFKHVKGVKNVVSGYAGGDEEAAHYDLVSTGTTGHAESVEIIFEPSQVAYSDLLRVFFSVAHDPTELNRQGPDTGTQYRSAIFFTNDEQKRTALAYIDQLNHVKAFSSPIVTQVVPLKGFYPAEEYHQNYLARHPDNPYILFYDQPKLRALQKLFPGFFRP